MRDKDSFVTVVVHCVAIATISWGCLSINAHAQEPSLDLDSSGRWINGVTEPWWFSESVSKDDIGAAQRRWATIGNETLALSEGGWAGNYFVGGDTHGSYLRWSPQNGFALFHVNKCEARVMAFSYGSAVVSPGLVQLLPEKTFTEPTKHGHRTNSTLHFLQISWRQSKYLVPENKIADFADYVAGLGSYNDRGFMFVEYAQFFSQFGVNEAAVAVPAATNKNNVRFVEPDVPPGFERFIKRPIDARITRLNKIYIRPNPENEWWDDLVIPLAIDAGRAQGLKPKMVLRILGTEGFGGDDEFVRITSVSLRSATGVVERPVRKTPCVKFAEDDDCSSPEYKPLRVGAMITTNPVRDNSPSTR